MAGFRRRDDNGGLRGFQQRVQRREPEALDAIALVLLRSLKVEVSTPGRGRLYRLPTARTRRVALQQHHRRGTPRLHRASAPGQPPTVDTGSYRESFAFARVSATKRRVGTDDKRATWFERGTLRMAKRPHFSVAFRKVEREMGDVLRDILGRP